MNAQEQREIAVFDSYAGLRRIGYTRLGAIKALRVLGLSLLEAKEASDRYEAADEPKPETCDKCGTRSFDTDKLTIETARQTHSSPAEHEEQVWCSGCVEAANQADQDGDYLRARASGWAD